ncbi:MAG: hypothetical protein LBE65_01355 [Synergistaceae bacterium]|jgi:hypothetical protein|nr:hypothetical protein [Synergistaceae bacterium]
MDEQKRPENCRTSESKEEQGTLANVNRLAPPAGAVIRLIELILKLIGVIRQLRLKSLYHRVSPSSRETPRVAQTKENDRGQ